MARFGAWGCAVVQALVRSRFRGPRARALFAGCAAHSFLSLDAAASASFGLVLALVGHATDWPCAEGGSQRIVEAWRATSNHSADCRSEPRGALAEDVPPARAVLFDVPPRAVERIAGDELPSGFRRNSAVSPWAGGFKIDWALAGPIPWRAPECSGLPRSTLAAPSRTGCLSKTRRRTAPCADRPFVLVAQQSLFDASRATRRTAHRLGVLSCAERVDG